MPRSGPSSKRKAHKEKISKSGPSSQRNAQEENNSKSGPSSKRSEDEEMIFCRARKLYRIHIDWDAAFLLYCGTLLALNIRGLEDPALSQRQQKGKQKETFHGELTCYIVDAVSLTISAAGLSKDMAKGFIKAGMRDEFRMVLDEANKLMDMTLKELVDLNTARKERYTAISDALAKREPSETWYTQHLSEQDHS
jgi:hypothetical protein